MVYWKLEPHKIVFHLCTIKVPMVYTIGQLECATYQCYFINALFDIFFKGCTMWHILIGQ